MPSARIYDEATHGVTLYSGDPDTKLTFTSSPFNWLEASFFYSNIDGLNYCIFEYDPVCNQDYKDKGFNFKLKVKEEGAFPAIAIGINDLGGTGYYGSEYIVASYGINNLDLHFGLGWGALNGSKNNFKNPLGYLSDRFNNRPDTEADVGEFTAGRYFSGETVSPFFGLSFAMNKKTLLKLEYDTTLTPGKIGYEDPKEDFSLGLEYSFNKNFSIGFFAERGNAASLKFIYKNNPIEKKSHYRYQKARSKENDDKYTKFIKNVENNGIGVNKILETSESIGIELTQFAYPNLDIVEEIIKSASIDAGISKEIKKDLRIADLQAVKEYDVEFENNSELIYERKPQRKFNTKNNISFRPFIASREEFFKGAIMLQNRSEFIISDNFFFTTNLKYSLADNFDDLTIPPKTTYPAQVRSDIKEYLRSFNEGIFIGRAQFDYHITPKKNHHIMATAGILEEMFSGIGFEYLYFKQDSNFAVGFEIFDVIKRDYEMRFGTLDYRNVVGSVNFYHRNYGLIPFDTKLSYGEYLAGDKGATIEFSRSFKNGTKFGVFASFTDVSSEQYGEGSFDKGVFFNVPIFGNFVNYSWKPLTKDPGAKLNRKHTLHDLLVKFRPIN